MTRRFKEKKRRKYLVFCPECKEPMRLQRSKNGSFYGCPNWPGCDGTHGAHPDGRPHGFFIGTSTPLERKRAQQEFDTLWKRREWKREQAYRWLAKKLSIPRKKCQFNQFDEATCSRVAKICERNEL